MAANGGEKDESFSDDNERVSQDSSSSEDVLESDSDDEEIVSMKLLLIFLYEREICIQ
jgi:hypothetical protein